MNWVGGARSRLRTKDEKKRQKEFFEKMRYSNKVKLLQRTAHSTKAPPPPASLDLLSLEAADFSATKFRKSVTEKSLRHKVKKVELEGGKGLFQTHHNRHHHHDLELPMSPCAASKLQLQEPEREQIPSTSRSFTLPATETVEAPLHWTIPEENSESSQSSCRYYHSTPVQAVSPTPQLIPQLPLKHQGKSSEDIFFSFALGCQDVSQSKEEEHLMSQYTACDDEALSDEFGYSPLSTTPSQSSVTSSTTSTTLSLDPATQDTVSSPAKTTFQWKETHCEMLFNRSSNNMIDLRENDIEVVPFPCKMMIESKAKNLPKDPHQMTLTPFIRKLQTNTKANQCLDLPLKEEKPTPRQTDMTCKEEDNFLSPFCPNAKPAKSATGQFQGSDMIEYTHIAKEESIEKQAPTTSMSKVCQQVLREVLQLDSKLQTNKDTMLQPPTPEDFGSFPTKEKRNGMEEVPSSLDSKSNKEATAECIQNTHSPEQPKDNSEDTTHIPKTPANLQHHQPPIKEEGLMKESVSHTEFQQQTDQLTMEDQRKQSKDIGEDVKNLQGKHPAANGQVECFNSSVGSNRNEQPAVSACQGPDSTSLEFVSHSRGIFQKDQAIQCLIIGAEPGQNKETQVTVDELIPAGSSHDPECIHGGRVIPVQGLRPDAHDECILS